MAMSSMLPEFLEELEWRLTVRTFLSNILHFKQVVFMLNNGLTVLAKAESMALQAFVPNSNYWRGKAGFALSIFMNKRILD